MVQRRTLRIFISSPGDVDRERKICIEVIERMQGKFGEWFQLKPVRWEEMTLGARRPPQETIANLIEPQETDIVIGILWSRIGTLLGESLGCKADGSTFRGTEWELENALNGFPSLKRRSTSVREFLPGEKKPEVFLFRRNAMPPSTRPADLNFHEVSDQWRALQDFMERRFQARDGKLKGWFEWYETLEQFAEGLESRLARHLEESKPLPIPSGLEGPKPDSWPESKGSPYCGLQTFDFDHAAVFCGRIAAIEEIKGRLVGRAKALCPFLLVVGPSGSGKSSLLRAGVLPRLCCPGEFEGIGHWRRSCLRPFDAQGETDLCSALADALVADDALPRLAINPASGTHLGECLRNKPEEAVRLIGQELQAIQMGGAGTARLILLVDQLEEIFTRDSGNHPPATFISEQAAFIRAVDQLARSGLVWIVATMRSDFLHRCEDVDPLIQLMDRDGTYHLRPPTSDEIKQMILQPAQAAGLEFEIDPKSKRPLDQLILVDAATDAKGSLPLLSFTLEQLFIRKSQGCMTAAAYDAIGGLKGAIGYCADEVLKKLSPELRACLPSVIRSLATVKTEDGPASEERIAARRVLVAMLASKPGQLALLKSFIEARLFVTDGTDQGPIVGVAHEALLTHWKVAKDILELHREFFRFRRILTMEAADWIKTNRAADFLIPAGERLDRALEFLETYADELEPSLTEYVDASRKHREQLRKRDERLRRRRKRLRSALLAATGLALVLVAYAYRDWNRNKIDYYGALVKIAGLPKPVALLTAEEAKHRQFTWKVTTRRGYVRRAEAVNAYGRPSRYHPDVRYLGTSSEKHDDCTYDYELDDEGKPSKEIAYDQDGKIVWQFQFDRPDRGHYVNKSAIRLALDGSKAVSVVFKQTSQGFDEVLFVNAEGNRVPNSEGVFGYRYVRDQRKMVIKETYLLDNSSKSSAARDGCAGYTATYDTRGNCTKMVYFGADGKPAVNKAQQCAITTYAYDSHGNQTEIRCCGVDENLVHCRQGWARLVATFDPSGNEIEATYFGTDNKPITIPTRIGNFARWTSKYDRQGNRVEITYVDANNQAVTLKDNYAEYTQTFDEYGRLLDLRYFGVNGEPALFQHRYTRMARQYDGRGNQTETAYYGLVPDKLVDGPDGFAKWTRSYDMQNRLTASYHYDASGALVVAPKTDLAPFAKLTIAYDDNGGQIEKRWDLDSSKALRLTGYANTTIDENGLKRTSYYDADFHPVPPRVVVAKVEAPLALSDPEEVLRGQFPKDAMKRSMRVTLSNPDEVLREPSFKTLERNDVLIAYDNQPITDLFSFKHEWLRLPREAWLELRPDQGRKMRVVRGDVRGFVLVAPLSLGSLDLEETWPEKSIAALPRGPNPK